MLRATMWRTLARKCRSLASTAPTPSKRPAEPQFSAIKVEATSAFSTKPGTPSQIILTRDLTKSAQTIMSVNVLSNENRGKQIEDIFQSAYQEIIDQVLADQQEVSQLAEAKKWLEKAIHYNIRNGKRNRAKSLFSTFELIAPELTKENVREACMLGWCIELLQAYFLIVDDIMDVSITRRGQLCWYRQDGVGMTAINDAIMVNNSLFLILKKNFSECENYLKMVELFNETTRNTAYGQCLDLLSTPAGKPVELSKYTIDRYHLIVQYKTSYYSFCLPARLALYLGNIADPVVHSKAEEILLQIGRLFQVQDDFLDCYGVPSVTGKIGTDIEDAKCGWLIVKALELANEEQKQVLRQCYGVKEDVTAASKVKAVYDQLHLEQVFKEYEKSEFDAICAKIDSLNEQNLPKDIFYNALSLIYQRNK